MTRAKRLPESSVSATLFAGVSAGLGGFLFVPGLSHARKKGEVRKKN